MKTVIVTGAAGNLGSAVVKRFLHDGYRVAGSVSGKGAAPFADQPAFSSYPVDLSDETAAAAFVAEVACASQRVEAAVLTVGGFALGNIAETGSLEIDRMIAVNFKTAYHVARPLLGHMMQKGYGRIVLIGSLPGADLHDSKGMTAYGLSKSLLFGLAKLMNHESAHRNIVTSVVIPGTIGTPENRRQMPNADTAEWVTPESIAAAIAWHCSPEADAIREPIIRVTGA